MGLPRIRPDRDMVLLQNKAIISLKKRIAALEDAIRWVETDMTYTAPELAREKVTVWQRRLSRALDEQPQEE